MNIDDNIYSLWMENSGGVRFVPKLDGPGHPGAGIPEDFIYQHSEFALSVHHDCLQIARKAEVDACKHPPDQVNPTGGWIEGVEGRKCSVCLGTQTRNVTEPWPEEWSSGGSTRVFSGSSSACADLVLAMTRPTEEERARSLARVTAEGYMRAAPLKEVVGTLGFVNPEYANATGIKAGDAMVMHGPEPKLYKLYEAILIASRACEGCMNVLLWEYGCEDGYPNGSEQHQRVGTSCLFCRPVETIHEGR